MILVHAHALIFSSFSKSTKSACTCTIPGALNQYTILFSKAFSPGEILVIDSQVRTLGPQTIKEATLDHSLCDGIIRVYEVDAT